MAKLTPFAGALLVVGVLWSGAGHAAGDDLAALKAELEALKKDYNAHIQALEARIKQLESAASTAAATPPAPAAAAPAVVTAAPVAAPALPEPAPLAAAAPNKGSNATAFNPAISMILTGNYASLSQDPATYRIAGFMPQPGAKWTRRPQLQPRRVGADGGGERRPVFLRATSPPRSQPDNRSTSRRRTSARWRCVTASPLKGGRFFSGTRLPERNPLARLGLRRSAAGVPGVLRRAARAGRGAAASGSRPPTTFIELGAEAGSGDSFPGTQRNRNGARRRRTCSRTWAATSAIPPAGARRVVAGLHVDDRSYEDTDGSGTAVTNAFSGTSRTWIVDAHDEVGAARRSDASPAEVAGRVHAPHARTGSSRSTRPAPNLIDGYSSSQSGWYVQGVYEFKQRWRAGLRYDSHDSGTPSIGLVSAGVLPFTAFPALLPASPERTTFMIDWSLSRVLAPARAVRVGRGACRARTRPAAAAAIHLFHRRPRRPQVLGSAHA